MKRRISSLLLLAALVVGQLSAGSFVFACEMHGSQHRSCCCDDESMTVDFRAAESAPAEGECACCEVETVERSPLARAGQVDTGHFVSPQIAIVPSPLVVSDLSPMVCVVDHLSLPPSPQLSSQLFARNCSFLI
jgi:hypothetical protein